MYTVMSKQMTSIQMAFTTGLTFKWLSFSMSMIFAFHVVLYLAHSLSLSVYLLFSLCFPSFNDLIKTSNLVTSSSRPVIVCKFNHTETSEVMNATSLHILTYLLTPCSRVLLEKLTGSQLVKKFSAFHGTQRFITTHTSAHHFIYLSEMKCAVLNVWIKEIH